MNLNILKLSTAFAAIPGSILIALNIPESGYGFFLFLYASTSWAYIAHRMGEKSLLAIEITFTIINLLGIYRWIII